MVGYGIRLPKSKEKKPGRVRPLFDKTYHEFFKLAMTFRMMSKGKRVGERTSKKVNYIFLAHLAFKS